MPTLRALNSQGHATVEIPDQATETHPAVKEAERLLKEAQENDWPIFRTVSGEQVESPTIKDAMTEDLLILRQIAGG